MTNDWTEIQIELPVALLEQGAAIAQMAVPYGFYLEDYSDLTTEAPKIAHIDLIDEELLQKDRTKGILHLYISPEENPAEAVSFLTQRMEEEQLPYILKTTNIREEDWAYGWKKYYHPMRVGQRIVVCPSWEQYDRKDGDVLLKLDPGMAFGTGTHETTRLCLEMLEKYIQPGSKVLDIGCGSGILSICGVLLGAQSALGVDIDKTAVAVALENARLNGVEEKAAYLCGDLAVDVKGSFQVVCANIVADVILRLTPDVKRFLAPGGVYLTSGIIDTREQEVADALQAQNYQILEIHRQNGWCAIAARPNSK